MVKYIIIGTIIGGMLGWAMDFSFITGLFLGAVAGGIIYFLYAKRNDGRIDETTESGEQKMLLREEQLDITKERVQTGEVKVHKEITEEQKPSVMSGTISDLILQQEKPC